MLRICRMNMKEKLDKKKMTELTRTSYEKDIENKQRELLESEESITLLKAEIGNVKDEIIVFGKIAKLMLENYGKIESKKEHKWEEQPEYWEFMKEKQVIDNKRKNVEYERMIKGFEKQIENTEQNITNLRASIKMTSIDLKEDEENDRE